MELETNGIFTKEIRTMNLLELEVIASYSDTLHRGWHRVDAQ